MRLGRALLVLVVPAFAALAGCELIAGTRDITEGEGGGEDDANGDSPGTNDALSGSDTPGSTGGDATASDATKSGDALPGTDGTMGVEAGSDARGLEATTTTGDSQADTSTKQDSAADTSTPDAGGSMYVLIDDMQLHSGQVSPPGGNGYWFTYNDGTDGGVETPTAGAAFTDSPISPPRPVSTPFASFSGASSTYAAQVSGSGFASYAGMGFNFINPSPTPTSYEPYDASAYIGFVFWGRISGSTTDGVVRFEVSDANTDSAGGICTTKCSDYLGKTLTFTSTWTQFMLLYTDLSQVGFGVPKETTLDAANVYGVQFQVNTSANQAFDIWVDDIYFIKP